MLDYYSQTNSVTYMHVQPQIADFSCALVNKKRLPSQLTQYNVGEHAELIAIYE